MLRKKGETISFLQSFGFHNAFPNLFDRHSFLTTKGEEKLSEIDDQCYKKHDAERAIQAFFYYLFYMSVQPEICQNIKNMLRTCSRLREEQFIFHGFYSPKSRNSELQKMSYMRSECK